MIIICCNNKTIVQRWQGILGGQYDLQTTHTLTELENCLESLPDAIILHDNLLGEQKTDQFKALKQKNEKLKYLILADKPDENIAFKFIHSGVYGYSNTYISPKLLCDAVKQILKGDVWMGKRLTRYLSECLLEDLNNEDSEDTAIDVEEFMTRLTDREKQVARRIAHGCSNKCVANALNITERTVKAHLSTVFKKTGIKDRVHLALILNSQKYI